MPEAFMDIRQMRFWTCALCDAHGIAEHRIEHTFEGEVPDQSNSDLSTHTGYQVVGGKLFADLPERPWRSHYAGLKDVEPAGGSCFACLSREDISRLVPHIRFA
ncbi:MAG TPA: hypothetical protein VMJ72_02295 [Candidatus Paceibacterota bacterium]|nr:hypothetical protein [Candidatus Paceibacterota bacterium]